MSDSRKFCEDCPILSLQAFGSAALGKVVTLYTLKRLNSLTDPDKEMQNMPTSHHGLKGDEHFCEDCALAFLNNADLLRHVKTVNTATTSILSSMKSSATNAIDLEKLGTPEAGNLASSLLQLVDLLNRRLK